MEMSKEAKAVQREYMKKWKEENRDKTNAYHRAWREANKDKVNEYNKRYWEKKAKSLRDES